MNLCDMLNETVHSWMITLYVSKNNVIFKVVGIIETNEILSQELGKEENE